MKLTDEQITTILEQFTENPEAKDTKLRLLAAFVQKVAPIVGFTPQGDVIADLMQWANEAHFEECESCRMVNETLKGFEQMIDEQEVEEAKAN